MISSPSFHLCTVDLSCVGIEVSLGLCDTHPKYTEVTTSFLPFLGATNPLNFTVDPLVQGFSVWSLD